MDEVGELREAVNNATMRIEKLEEFRRGFPDDDDPLAALKPFEGVQ